jgi:hypothetical protein
MTQTLKNALAFALLAGVALLGYLMFLQRDAGTLLLGQSGPVTDQLLTQASGFIEKRMLIESLQIDTSVLINPRFTGLNNYAEVVPEQPVGKVSLFESAQELSTNR